MHASLRSLSGLNFFCVIGPLHLLLRRTKREAVLTQAASARTEYTPRGPGAMGRVREVWAQ